MSLARALSGAIAHNFGSDPVSKFYDVPTAASIRIPGIARGKAGSHRLRRRRLLSAASLTRRDLGSLFARARLGSKLASREAYGLFLDVARKRCRHGSVGSLSLGRRAAMR